MHSVCVSVCMCVYVYVCMYKCVCMHVHATPPIFFEGEE